MSTNPSNAEWVAALEAGQEAAWADIRQRVLRNVLSVLRRHARAEINSGQVQDLAEDVTQTTLVAVKAKLGTFRNDSRFTTWVYRIAINTLLADLRRRRWTQRVPTELSDTLPLQLIEEAAANPEHATARHELWTLLRRLIDTELTPHQRAILLAQAFQGQPLDVIAAVHGINRDAVYKVLHDARRKLRATLLQYGLTQADILRMFEQP
jgi:RNA polymerase sigma-70 factor, ECF subfamily